MSCTLGTKVLLFGIFSLNSLGAFFCLIHCLAVQTLASDSEAYLQELQERAHSARLWERREWEVLLHYRSLVLGQYLRSLADDPQYFLSPQGKTKPEAELEATLAAFFSADTPDPNDHPQCKFLARYRWLKRELAFDDGRLTPRQCPRFSEWSRAIAAQGVTLVYPASYLNNPASMFGHTLLRLDGAEQGPETRMLAYAANYGAATAETSGVVFAVRGLLGGYKGTFSVLPYYERIKKYSDMEHRDIWEYELNLTPEEATRLIEAMWELKQTYFDYYFFDENCSYHLLFLLEFARPSLSLAEKFPFWAIPVDTVRATISGTNLLKNAVYRPSAATVLRSQAAQASGATLQLARSLALDQATFSDASFIAQSATERAQALELAINYLSYRLTARQGDEQRQRVKAHQLLLERSKYGNAGFLPVEVPAVRPDQGHQTARASLGFGLEEDEEFLQFNIRPAFHDRFDPQGGFLPGSEIDFLSFSFRKYEGRDLELERFVPVSITSLAARDFFFKPLSWKIHSGVERRRREPGRGDYALVVSGGPGLTYAWEESALGSVALYGLGALSVDYGPGFAGDNLAFGPGVIGGVSVDPSSSLRLALEASLSRFFLGAEHLRPELKGVMRYTTSTNTAWKLEFRRVGEYDRYFSEGIFTWNLFF